MHLNAHEITCEGVTMLVKMVENISIHDIFLDVGSGIGNVIAQIALQTPVGFTYGVEIRKDVVSLSKRLMAKQMVKYPALSKVWQIDQDICRLSEAVIAKLRKVTILYSSNQLFEEDAKLRLRNLIAKMVNLRVLVVALKFCSRHRESCDNYICRNFVLQSKVDVPVCWTSNKKALFVYKKVK